MRRSPALVLLVIGLTFALTTSGAFAIGSSGDLAPMDEDDLEIDPDDILMHFTVAETGDAEVRIENRVRLETDDEIAAFEELESDIEENPQTYVDRFEERITPTVESAADSTNRDMTVEDISVEAERRFIERDYGIVTYRFNWTSFAALEDDELHIGDALDRLFLTEETSLVIVWPAEYTLVEVDPSPGQTTDTSARWSGPLEFEVGEPRLVVAPAEGEPVDENGLPISPILAIGIIVVLLVVLGGGWYYVRDERSSGTSASIGSGTSDADMELLSNEERVLKLLEDRNGRMKQKEVAEALEWTDAKTSKVVSNLRESGDVEAFRLGRENVLRLPEEEES